MNKFELSEIRGRKKIEKFFNYLLQDRLISLEFSKNNYDKFDAVLMYRKRCSVYSAAIETKDRNYNSDKYSDWILEYNKLKSWEERNEDFFLYVNTYADEVIRVWNITDDLIKSCNKGERWLPSTTMSNRGCKNKKVVYLPSNKTIITDKL